MSENQDSEVLSRKVEVLSVELVSENHLVPRITICLRDDNRFVQQVDLSVPNAMRLLKDLFLILSRLRRIAPDLLEP